MALGEQQGAVEEMDDAEHVKNLPASECGARPSRATADLDAQFRDLDIKAGSGSGPHTLQVRFKVNVRTVKWRYGKFRS